jgi:hypothetical protein
MKRSVFSRKQDRKTNKQHLSSFMSTDLSNFDEHQMFLGGIYPEDLHRLNEQERKISLKSKKSRDKE